MRCAPEPRALAIRRHDIALRHLLSHSIQLLAKDGSLQRLVQEYFPENDSPAYAVTLWDGLGKPVSPTHYAGELRYPARYIVPRLSRAGVLRVGGIEGGAQASSAGQVLLAALNASLVRELGSRWRVTTEIVSSTADEAADLLAKRRNRHRCRRKAGLAAGPPRWTFRRPICFTVTD